MATVARGMTTDKRSAEGARKELSRKAVATIGRAPRNVVCFNCAKDNEIILGRIDSDRSCPRCRKKIVRGAVVQGPAYGRGLNGKKASGVR
jgi:DNA-directed RNA polymerase subunit RPC12/RpoP